MNASGQRRLRAVVLICAIVVVSLLHYLTPTSHVLLHPLLQRAYYIPILLMALWFGWRGGLLAAAIAGMLYIPHIAMAWGSNEEYSLAQYVEIGMFFVIAPLIGVLADVERRRSPPARATGGRSCRPRS